MRTPWGKALCFAPPPRRLAFSGKTEHLELPLREAQLSFAQTFAPTGVNVRTLRNDNKLSRQ